MPELPEVQTVVDDLKALGLEGVVLSGATVYWPKTVVGLSPPEFNRGILGRRIIQIKRRAKFILLFLEQGWCLAIHLRMTGRLELRMARKIPGEHVHVVLQLEDGRELAFHDTRKFGRFYLLQNPGEFLGKLGPEPFDPQFTKAAFFGRLAGRKRQIKPLLLDQTFLAGLGNIYVDEALWEAEIHPMQPASRLSAEQAGRLHTGIRKVLRKGIRNSGTTLGTGKGNFRSLRNGQGRNLSRLNVFRRTGQPCPRCGTRISRIAVGQRSTHFCRRCQVET